jgi:hypothetical protein
MIIALALLTQAAALAPAPAPIRVWIAEATVHVSLRDPGYLTVLHVDPAGRVRVLFPLRPDDNAATPRGFTFELAAPAGADNGTGTIVAARTRRPLQVAGLRAGSAWDYDHGLLFQPTAGNPVAALLDIADRMADGRPFDFDVTTYRIGGPVAAQDPQLTTPVCLACVRRLTVEEQSTVALNQANVVTCSDAVLVNSSCGVIDNRVTNTYVYNEAAAVPAPLYVPYYVPVFVPRRRLSEPAAEPAASRPERQSATLSMPTTQARPFVFSSSLIRSIRARPH